MLGPPMITEQLKEERLSKPLALGVLSCDGISSANYGSELILHELLPFFGLASFTLLMPLTGVILLGIFLVVLSYREVVDGLHPGWRLLRGGPGELRPAGRPGRGRGADGGLRGHGRGAELGGQRRDPVHLPGAGPAAGRLPRPCC